MLIAEDSEIAKQLEALFSEEYDTVVARTGKEGFREVDAAEHFDICIVDIIMPVEDPRLSLRDADETGVRLIKHIVERGKATRVLVLTVRGDVENAIRDVADGAIIWQVLRKQEVRDGQMIRDAVATLMAKTIPE